MTHLRAIRLTYGLALVARPHAVLTRSGLRADPRALVFARVLGARHLAQAAAASEGGSRAARAAAVVDALHAASALALAVAAPGHRRGLLVNAAVAATLWLAGASEAQTAR